MWTQRLSGVPQCIETMAVTIKGKVYAFSSFYTCHSDIDELEYITHVYTLDFASYRWVLLKLHSLHADVPMRIAESSIVAYGHCAYMWGISRKPSRITGLYCFDTQAMKWSRLQTYGEIPAPSFNQSACVVGHRMYTFDASQKESFSKICFLDLENFRWHRVRTTGQAPTGYSWCWYTTNAIGTRLYVWDSHLVVEWGNDRSDSSIYYLETTIATWVRPQVQGMAPMALQGRTCHSAFVYDREMYIFGGYHRVSETYFADMHKYNPVKSCWSEVTPFRSGPTARHSACCSILGERVFFFGGFRAVENGADAEHIGYASDDEDELTDLYVLHLEPTLKNLCLLAVIDAGLDICGLPARIRNEDSAITSSPS